MASWDSARAGMRQKLASTASPSSADAAAWSASSAEVGGACANAQHGPFHLTSSHWSQPKSPQDPMVKTQGI